jgi:hypothetical protein
MLAHNPHPDTPRRNPIFKKATSNTDKPQYRNARRDTPYVYLPHRLVFSPNHRTQESTINENYSQTPE